MPTHEVTNQVPPLVGHDTSRDPALRAALEREGAGWALPERRGARHAGRHRRGTGVGTAGRGEPAGALTHDRWGHRVDEVEYDPAYHG